MPLLTTWATAVLPGPVWHVRYVRALDEHGTTAAVDARTGKVVAFRRTFPETEKGASPDESVSRAKAVEVLRTFGEDPAKWTVVSASGENRKARRDTRVVFESKADRAGEAARRLVRLARGRRPVPLRDGAQAPRGVGAPAREVDAAEVRGARLEDPRSRDARRPPRRRGREGRARRDRAVEARARARGAPDAARGPRARRGAPGRPLAVRLAVHAARLLRDRGRRTRRRHPRVVPPRVPRRGARPRREARRDGGVPPRGDRRPAAPSWPRPRPSCSSSAARALARSIGVAFPLEAGVPALPFPPGVQGLLPAASVLDAATSRLPPPRGRRRVRRAPPRGRPEEARGPRPSWPSSRRAPSLRSTARTWGELVVPVLAGSIVGAAFLAALAALLRDDPRAYVFTAAGLGLAGGAADLLTSGVPWWTLNGALAAGLLLALLAWRGFDRPAPAESR